MTTGVERCSDRKSCFWYSVSLGLPPLNICTWGVGTRMGAPAPASGSCPAWRSRYPDAVAPPRIYRLPAQVLTSAPTRMYSTLYVLVASLLVIATVMVERPVITRGYGSSVPPPVSERVESEAIEAMSTAWLANCSSDPES